MPGHCWGDEWFEKNGQDLEDAITFIWEEVRKRGNIGLHMKEKYGTIRYEFVECAFWSDYWPIYSYFYPGYLYYNWPRWAYQLERPIAVICQALKIYKIIHKRQMKILHQVMCEVVRKYPHIKDEILADFNYTFEDLIKTYGDVM